MLFVQCEITFYVFIHSFIVSLSTDGIATHQQHMGYDTVPKHVRFGIVLFTVGLTVVHNFRGYIPHCPTSHKSLQLGILVIEQGETEINELHRFILKLDDNVVGF